MARNSYTKHSDKAGSGRIPVFSDVVSAVNTAYKTVDDLGRAAIQKSNAFFDSVFGLSIDRFCDFNSRNRVYMERLMRINDMENELTLDTIGSDSYENGDSHDINANVLHPSYAAKRDYIVNYYNTILAETSSGLNTTILPKPTNYETNSGNENENYGQGTRAYYDDNDTLQYEEESGVYGRSSTIQTNNRNSILYKTKRLFRDHKINTIISRFHTEHMNHGNDEPTSRYGLSHGRNLLTKAAEEGISYSTNGYDNPYCRVWTHHYQYDRLDKLIRPFYVKDSSGQTRNISLKEFHNWKNFVPDGGEWGWKNNNSGWDHVVLNDNGFVNFAPSFTEGGRRNIHTKQCMFSLENLAWKGFDPYSFEKALSWEQRGPNGGRIMWFAPYGIAFSESTNTEWNEHTFIGRGESVYTYANTRRTGTLSFMMVVDHPSIVDYVTWKENDNVKDTDMLRFFAGCDGGSSSQGNSDGSEGGASDSGNGSQAGSGSDGYGSGLSDNAFPTPLTDEYVEKIVEVTKEVEIEKPKEPYEVEECFVFYVFYPNNYSGVTDDGDKNPDLDPMAYLLAGLGAQTSYEASHPVESVTLPLLFDSLNEGVTGNGYEMGGAGVSSGVKDDTNYIHGTSRNWETANRGKSSKWVPAKDGFRYKWYYRIDGRYTENGQEEKSQWNINCYDQRLERKESYLDTTSYGFNSDAKAVEEQLSRLLPIEGELFSFAQVAYVLANENGKTVINQKVRKPYSKEDDEIKKLTEILKAENVSTKISSIEVSGYSNSDGYNASKGKNTSRNMQLADNRAESVISWLKKYLPDLSGVIKKGAVKSSVDNGNTASKADASSAKAKAYRSACVKVTYKSTQTKQQAETENTDPNAEVRYVGFERQVDVDGATTGFKDEEGNIWQFDEERNCMVRMAADGVMDRNGYGNFRTDKEAKGIASDNGGNDYNKVRYDQEYHFFKVLEKKDPFVFSKLMDKLKYFDPAFHSTTPEGFNARLTFLSQCMRQGSTLTISDASGVKGQLTNNLAFGRAPYCVLRLGDFYNQMIVIDNITVTYDPLQWDLNTEGIGVQPLLANVQLSFKFVGGGDLAGPIRRLQNAMTFNYYANTRLYDNRADRLERDFDYKTNTDQEVENGESKSYYHDVKMK